MRAGRPSSAGNTAGPVSSVPVEPVQVSSISSQRPRWSWPRGEAFLPVKIAHSAAPPPSRSAASLVPSARRSPSPSRRLIIWRSRFAALGVAPREPEAELLLGDVALLLALHHPAAEPAELVDVDAGAVELGVEPGDGDRIGAPDGPPGARPPLVLRLVDDRALVLAARQDLHVAVVHAAGVALVAAVVEAVPERGRLPLLHVDARQRHVRRVVLDRERAEPEEVHDARQRAVLVERLGRGVGPELVGDVVGRGDEAPGIGRPERPVAPDDGHRLQALLPHDGADAVLGRDVAVVALDRGEAHQVLAGGADRVDAQHVARAAELAVQRVLRLPGVLADEVPRVAGARSGRPGSGGTSTPAPGPWTTIAS